ncbi:MAG: hypothetical protein EOO02_10310 [Chitinophagaceae bacterium]|nr:MAG: hypothetical protein EOO02_10310 [Chitinophagaceae bacterium]
MYRKLSELSFVIGLFFVIVSVILIINGFVSGADDSKLTIYSATVFLIFGLLMLVTKNKDSEQD